MLAVASRYFRSTSCSIVCAFPFPCTASRTRRWDADATVSDSGGALLTRICITGNATTGVFKPTNAARSATRSISMEKGPSNTSSVGSTKEVVPTRGDVSSCAVRSIQSRSDIRRTAAAWSRNKSHIKIPAESSGDVTSWSSTWTAFLAKCHGRQCPLLWELLLGSQRGQPLLMARYVAAAAAVATASCVTAIAADVPATAVRLLLIRGLCTQHDQEVAELGGLPNHLPLAEENIVAPRVFATAASLHDGSSGAGLPFNTVGEREQPEHKQPELLLLPGSTHRGQDHQRAKPQQPDESYMSWKEVWHVFGIAALPMVGFGLMDQLIMIRLGDLLDTTLGVKFGLATLSAAAVGQLCSDTAGVLFGSTIESCANRLGFPPPNLTAAQRASAVFSLSKTLGAASGVCCGCLLGMLQLLVLDLDRADRLKHQQQLDTILETVLVDGPKLFHCERAALFVYDASRDEVWSKAVFGEDKAIRMQKQKNKCFTTWVIENKAILNCPEASEDPRFNPEFDEKIQQKTRSVLAAPVIDASGEVIAALVFFNKHPQFRGRFSEDDERMVEMMSRHVQIFMEKFEYGAADDRRMISLPESEHVSQYHAAGASAEKIQLSSSSVCPWDSPPMNKSRSNTALRASDDDPGVMEATAVNGGKGERIRTTNDITGAADKPEQEHTPQPPVVRCGTCSSTGCVLLHSLGPTTVNELCANEKTTVTLGSVRRGLATAAVAAATAAGIDTIAPDGARAWWLRWLFFLPEDDDYLLLPSDGVSPAAVKRQGESGETFSEGGDVGPPGGGDPKRRKGPPPPYWKATFPHLYGSTSKSSARIVEVDRE